LKLGAAASAAGLAALLALAPIFAAHGAAEQAGDVDATGQLRDPALQARFERITHELRCLVCQNESIADSNVELAGNLRRQVRDMLIAHRSDDDIMTFMTDRYGEFVRFSPPLEAKTLLIWGAPFIMMLFGGLIVVRIARQRAHMPIDE
jgi:cytochrome c-type biogenesis protein CcmH